MKTVFKAIVSYTDYDAYDSEGLFTTFEKAKEWALMTAENAVEVSSVYVEEIELDTNKSLVMHNILTGETY